MKLLILGGDKSELEEALKITSVIGDCETYGLTFKGDVGDVKQFFNRLYIVKGEFNVETAYSVMIEIFEDLKPDLTVSVASKNTNDILSRLAQKYRLPMTTEAINVKLEGGKVISERIVLGGRAVSVEELEIPAVLTIAYGKFKEIKCKAKEGAVEEVEAEIPKAVKVIERKVKERSEIDIETAEVVIGVGRGFKRKEDLELAYELAKILNGQVGCTRPIAADYGWLPEDLWIGITGKKIRPKLYIAIGISGAPQHITTALDSKVIVAINSDENAPIFQYSDYYVVADLYKFLPVFIKVLKGELKG